MFRYLPVLWVRLGMAVAMALALFSPLASASAQVDSAAGATAAARNGRILGIHLARGVVGGATTLGSGKLTYHGGPVEHTNAVYAIYWVPSGFTVDTNYVSLINRFFGDVAAADGKTSDVYYSDTQYSDTVNGKILYNSTFAGSVTDTDPLPASGCVDTVTSVCLTDAQIQAEVQAVVAKQGWTANSTTEFFMFTAKGIGGCFDSTNTQCSFTYYCAYHSWIGSGNSAMLYANMPYADTDPSACDVGQHPNGDDADATINVTSHEHNETITDEQGNAWYDAAGYENGDKCAWIFGRELGTTGAKYNQAINGNHYLLQEEWSNATNRCVARGT